MSAAEDEGEEDDVEHDRQADDGQKGDDHRVLPDRRGGGRFGVEVDRIAWNRPASRTANLRIGPKSPR